MAVNVTRFPDGLDGLSKKIHDMKLKFGIYSSTFTSQLYIAEQEVD